MNLPQSAEHHPVSAAVLVLDDRVDDRKLMRRILERAGHRVYEATTAEQALQLIAAHEIDLVITDIVMPVVNGYEFVRRLRESAGGAGTPVIFSTGNYLEGEIQQLAATLGVHHFMRKPIRPETVVATVEEALILGSGGGDGGLTPPGFDLEHARLLNDKLVQKVLELEDLSAERQKLVGQLLRAHEEERDRIANDLHDDAIQAMAAVQLRLHMLGSRMAGTADAPFIQELRDAVGDAIHRLRGLLAGLQSIELGRQSLTDAVAMALETISSERPIEATLQSEIATEPEPMTRTALYRTTQEVLTNVRKHSDATRVDVRILEDADGYRVVVRDDGRGFSVPEAMRVRPGHIGLPSVRARLEMLGGSLELESEPGAGATIQLRVPRTPAPG
jgi:signal transduction histidine kinase